MVTVGSQEADLPRCDVAIIGDGVIGLSTALELVRAGAQCQVFGAGHHEAASGAAAGLLAPSIGNLSAAVRPFFTASLERYPDFVSELQPYEPALRLIDGLLDLSADAGRAHRDFGLGEHLTAEQVSVLEPAAFAPKGGVFHRQDAAVDNQALVRALRAALAAFPGMTIEHRDSVVSIDLSGRQAALRTANGCLVDAQHIVLAAGAWSPSIAGLPRRLPITPLKGQMLAVASSALHHAIMSDDIYLVPRATEIAIGATVEHAGFDVTVVPEAIESMRQAALRLCPALEDAPVLRSWAGLRPATPDMLPILGPDPQDARLIYACGHSKNGILLAPATARAIAAVVLGESTPFNLTPFRVDRFPVSRSQ